MAKTGFSATTFELDISGKCNFFRFSRFLGLKFQQTKTENGGSSFAG